MAASAGSTGPAPPLATPGRGGEAATNAVSRPGRSRLSDRQHIAGELGELPLRRHDRPVALGELQQHGGVAGAPPTGVVDVERPGGKEVTVAAPRAAVPVDVADQPRRREQLGQVERRPRHRLDRGSRRARGPPPPAAGRPGRHADPSARPGPAPRGSGARRPEAGPPGEGDPCTPRRATPGSGCSVRRVTSSPRPASASASCSSVVVGRGWTRRARIGPLPLRPGRVGAKPAAGHGLPW